MGKMRFQQKTFHGSRPGIEGGGVFSVKSAAGLLGQRERVSAWHFRAFTCRLAIALVLLLGISPLAQAETVRVSRRLVRFDSKPAAGAKVRVLSDYAYRDYKTDLETIADAQGVFSVDVIQDKSLWVGHIVVRAEGCAAMCEFAVTGQRKNEPLLERRLGPPFKFEGKTLDAKGRPVAGAKVSLAWVRPKSWNPTPFNSTTTQPLATPEFVASSATNGTWTMMGVDFVLRGDPTSASVVFEAVADQPALASLVTLELEPNPGAKRRENIPLHFRLAPLIRVAGHITDSVTGQPVPGVSVTRNVLFTTLPGSSAVTDETGSFDLRIPGPLPMLWFQTYRDGFAATTAQTAMRQPPTSDWRPTNDLLVRLRPLVLVSGRMLDQTGKPPDEPVLLGASYGERIDGVWSQKGSSLTDRLEIGADGAFSTKLPAGDIDVDLRRPPQSMGSMSVVGMSAANYQLHRRLQVPGAGMKDLQLRPTRIEKK